MTDPIAQGTDAAPVAETTNPENQQAQTQPQEQSQHAGLQKRIDEITAARRDAEAKYAALSQQMAEQSQVTAQLAQQLAMREQMAQATPQVPALPAVPEGMDPAFAAWFQKTQEAMLARTEALRADFNKTLSEQRASQLASQFPSDVAQRAQQLMRTWNQSGKQGYVPEDAYVYAMGEKAAADAQKARLTGQLAAFSGGGSMPTLPAPPPAHVAPAVQPVPADIDNWPPQKQADYWEKRIGDVPLTTS